MKIPNISCLFLILFILFGCSKEVVQTQNPIPENAEIVFHENNFIYVMDENGNNVVQITFDNPYTLEHVAVSYDRQFLIANYFSVPEVGGQSSKLLLFDLLKGTTKILLPEFAMAGNGGVDWDKDGFIYFAGVSKFPFSDPKTIPEFKANAGANDIFKIKFDGSGLQNLTATTDRGEADVSVSPNSKHIAYMATNIGDPSNTFTEIWKRNINGENPEMLYRGGKDRISSVHDPEISPKGDYVVFSKVNNKVPPVFPYKPLANTAHDIFKLNILNESQSFSITQPGPISIAPDWIDDKILYLEITDKTIPPHAGLAVINADGTGYQLIKNGANIGKWIPKQ